MRWNVKRPPLWMAALCAAALPSILPAQAMVEYGLATAASGMAGASSKRAASGIGGVFSTLTKTLDATKGGSTTPAPAAPQPDQAAAAKLQSHESPLAPPPLQPEKATVIYEDPAGIQVGMDRAELLRRFGDPSMRITTGPGCESLTYTAKDRSVELELRDGKVAFVGSMPMPKPKPQNAVVLLQ